MTVLAAVVANWASTLWAVASLMPTFTAVIASPRNWTGSVTTVSLIHSNCGRERLDRWDGMWFAGEQGPEGGSEDEERQFENWWSKPDLS